ncbi:hypothetical protein EJ03DRAFT_324422 [Teratosphaeria nubilosa]|uniref:Uncharacterized protein n=1 Tax=Teratosphaeria nubilosa TaxID=161662 RepID=A0A6G1LIZ5_9PEZI|nr:hypothetical protein EJ03DRAFT_324422 [Teratosphaeria nubilosa]
MARRRSKHLRAFLRLHAFTPLRLNNQNTARNTRSRPIHSWSLGARTDVRDVVGFGIGNAGAAMQVDHINTLGEGQARGEGEAPFGRAVLQQYGGMLWEPHQPDDFIFLSPLARQVCHSPEDAINRPADFYPDATAAYTAAQNREKEDEARGDNVDVDAEMAEADGDGNSQYAPSDVAEVGEDSADHDMSSC